MKYDVEFTSSARRQIKKLPKSAREEVLRIAASLSETPRPQGCVKLTGREAWRVRTGSYRVIYEIEDDHLLVTVVRAGHRREVYDR